MKLKSILVIIVLLFSYTYLGYVLDRMDYLPLILAFILAFTLQGYLWYSKALSYRQNWYLAILTRLSLLMSLPLLSDDYFRFIWDGQLTASGINPFKALPSFYITESTQNIKGITEGLFNKLNSPNYFTVYPPICQGVFWLSAKIAGSSILGQVIVMRICLLLAELVAILGLDRLMNHLSVSKEALWLYALNPLVIIELTGNLHFEAIMIAGIIWSLYYLLVNKWFVSALCMLIAVNAKLLPLMLLPSILPILGIKKSLQYYLVIGMGTLLAFMLFIDIDMLSNILSSINLYFQRFEFNASFYYIIRWLGYELTGYNLIREVAPMVSLAVMIIIILISLKPLKTTSLLAERWVWIFMIYLLGATVVHPWYILVVVALSSLTCYRFSLVWSVLIVFSYSAYQSETYQENLWLVATEYVMLFTYLLLELYLMNKKAPEIQRP